MWVKTERNQLVVVKLSDKEPSLWAKKFERVIHQPINEMRDHPSNEWIGPFKHDDVFIVINHRSIRSGYTKVLTRLGACWFDSNFQRHIEDIT